MFLFPDQRKINKPKLIFPSNSQFFNIDIFLGWIQFFFHRFPTLFITIEMQIKTYFFLMFKFNFNQFVKYMNDYKFNMKRF